MSATPQPASAPLAGARPPVSAGSAACEALSLDQLQPNLCGIVQEITADDEDAQRLKAMGVCLGRRVEVIQRGDPLILRVLGSRLGLSSRLAARVRVQSCEAPECQPNKPA